MGNEKYIICVDDEKIVLDSLSSQLIRNFGYQYHYEFAESAEEALEIVEDLMSDENVSIAVVISDWLMPGMKGDQLLEKIHEKVKNVKTILLTGHIENSLVQKIENQAHDKINFIYKPWEEKHLIHLITN